jgi:hypothetical protein
MRTSATPRPSRTSSPADWPPLLDTAGAAAKDRSVASTWTRTILGTRSRLLSVIGVLVVLILVLPIVLLVLGLVVPAVVSVVIGLLGMATVVRALLPGH